MLKFRHNNSTKIQNFEEFISSMCIIIDELYKNMLQIIYPKDVINIKQNYQIQRLYVSICGELIQKIHGLTL